MSTLAERIEIIRREAGLTLEAIGKLAGATKSAVHQWANGSTDRIGGEYAMNLEDRIGYSARWIVTGEEPKTIREVKEKIAEYAVAEKIKKGELLDLSGLSPGARRAIETTFHALEELNESTNRSGTES